MNVSGSNVLEDDFPFCNPLLGDGELVRWIILELDILFRLIFTIVLLDKWVPLGCIGSVGRADPGPMVGVGDGDLVGWIIVVLLAAGKRDMNPLPYKAAEI